MHGLVVALLRPDAGAAHQSEGADDAARLVAQDVSLHVVEQHHAVELRRVRGQLKGGVVHQDERLLHVRVARRHLLHHLLPQPRGGQDVGFVHHGEAAGAGARLAERHLGDLLDLLPRVAAVVAGVAPAGVLALHLFTKVDAAHQLPDHQDVDAVADDLGAQRRQPGQPPRQRDRAVVGKGVVALPQLQHRQFRALVHRDRPHLFQRHAGRALQDRVGGVAHLLGLRGKRGAAGKPGAGAERGALIGEVMAVARGHRVQHLHRLGDDLRPDAVAFEEGD